jgi:hypothetical protein
MRIAQLGRHRLLQTLDIGHHKVLGAFHALAESLLALAEMGPDGPVDAFLRLLDKFL